MDTTSNANTMQSTSTSGQNTLPSTTVNTTPHYTGNTLPNVVPQATPNPHVQYTTLPTQGGHNPSPYYYVPPTNAAFKNYQPATHLLPPYSQVAYLHRQQVCTYISYQIKFYLINFLNNIGLHSNLVYVEKPQQMSLHSNGSITT